MRLPLRAFLLVFLLPVAAACATARAEPPVVLPPLDVPPVPARTIAALPQPVNEVPPAELEFEPAPTIPPAPPQQPVPPAAREGGVPPAGEGEPLAVPPTPEAVLELRLPQGGDDQQVEQQIRERLSRAGAMLRQINAATLRGEARVQFDTARRFREQGEQALRTRNYVFASYLADKAETMARELLRR